MDEVYASLAYDGAPLLRVPVCVSIALLVHSSFRNTSIILVILPCLSFNYR